MQTSKLPSIFKKPKPRQFKYSPLYYDPVKEEQKQKQPPFSRSDLNYRKWPFTYSEVRRSSHIRANIRLIIIIFGLLALGYYLWTCV